ncbi:MAG: methylglutamate dehydrogenase [Steroidobacteraceae bacterium]
MTRRSPLADWHLQATYRSAEAPVWLQDCSWRQRFGCKGPQASTWLESLGLTVPQPANSCAMDTNDVLVARLGATEFLVEAMGLHGQTVVGARERFPVPGVYPVIRQDAAFTLGGPRANDLLLETCSYPFASDANGTLVVMTSMVGVGVTVVPHRVRDTTRFHVWCDPSFGLYLWSTLVEIAEEMGGGAIASDGLKSTLRGES